MGIVTVNDVIEHTHQVEEFLVLVIDGGISNGEGLIPFWMCHHFCTLRQSFWGGKLGVNFVAFY